VYSVSTVFRLIQYRWSRLFVPFTKFVCFCKLNVSCIMVAFNTPTLWDGRHFVLKCTPPALYNYAFSYIVTYTNPSLDIMGVACVGILPRQGTEGSVPVKDSLNFCWCHCFNSRLMVVFIHYLKTFFYLFYLGNCLGFLNGCYAYGHP